MQNKNSNNNILILGDIFVDIFQTTNVVKISPKDYTSLQPKKYKSSRRGWKCLK